MIGMSKGNRIGYVMSNDNYDTPDLDRQLNTMSPNS